MKKLNLNIQMFASTNKTANYDLPQFVGTDKPTWLGDFNEAMFDIDAAMHENATDIASVETVAENASSAASQASQDVAGLTSTVNTLSTNVSAVTQTANNAQQTATSALNTANTANTKATTALEKATTNEENIANFNLTSFKTITKTAGGSEMTCINGSIIDGSSITIAKNSDGSLAKVYGTIFVGSPTSIGACEVTIANSGLAPEEDININNAGIYFLTNAANTNQECVGVSLTIKTDGSLKMSVYAAKTGGSLRLTMLPQLYFVKDFGDVEQASN